MKTIKTGIYTVHSTLLKKLNKTLLSGFLNHQEDTDIKRSHLFNGRYENIYLDETQITELKTLRDEACRHASTILETANIRAGYWFNYMPPGSVTTMHTHDDDDELLSGVYYVTVPEDSGNLIISENSEKIEIKPEAGSFIFFKPDVRHEVSRNNSTDHRLSIGINFGTEKK